jgi:phospholipase C
MARRPLRAGLAPAVLAAVSMVQPMGASRAFAQSATGPVVTAQPAPNADVAPYVRDPAGQPLLSEAQMTELVRAHVKYVFVLFQENRSFDHYFGTFRGADGLFSDGSKPRVPATNTQSLYDTNGKLTTVSSFRIGPEQNASDLDDIDHGHPRMAAKMHLVDGVPKMDRFALDEQVKYWPGSPIDPATPPAQIPLRSKQFGELAMAYVDCDTVPFLWNYANKFTLFDNIFQTTVGPSTPNAIAMISGQAGETQWVEHPDEAKAGGGGLAGSTTVPVTNDPIPLWGTKDAPGTPPQAINIAPLNNTQPPPAPQQKNESGKPNNIAPSLTYASLPLTLAGKSLATVTQKDADPAHDLADIQQDIPFITGHGTSPFAWGWYQNGYDAEPGLPDVNGIRTLPHASYIGHHNGPQYFGYVANNPEETAHLHGLGDFFSDVAAKKLPDGGGVFYVRGGYDNIQGLKPDTSNAANPADAAYIAANFLGDDDHPAYSDSQISEALLATEINAIASSPYWPNSAIIITYDESEGDYDHVPPRIMSYDPAGLPLSRGPRIPLILISPFARAHVVSHEEGDHNSVIRLINTLFGLSPLADLPDEMAALVKGQTAPYQTGPAGFVQKFLGPHDDPNMPTGALLSAFDPARLQGAAPPLPAEYAMIPAQTVTTLPHYGNKGCSALGLTTEDRVQGLTNTIPADFFARPSQTMQ